MQKDAIVLVVKKKKCNFAAEIRYEIVLSFIITSFSCCKELIKIRDE